MNRLLRILVIFGAALLVLFGLSLFGFVKLMSPSPHVFLETPSPDGKLSAHLERPGGSMEPIYYSVKVTGAKDCTAATLNGLQAERWVRLSWDGGALVVRYGMPDDPDAKAVAPEPQHGGEGCHGMSVRVIEDNSLSVSGKLNDAIGPTGNGQ
ncbi:hypothetical protein [Sphingomonas sp.]|jgi:hypothetical protein|uniref:hypothetical protein n=1 Tax=Sphingomonas sp. TaxID=28214 RepID=UPI002E2F486C|nr:hypothetical protein [Sphingomonas sp.]HEX4693366.1 hypothetical protein [Sphingomonas sp.]